jgi:hypothetical protein
VLEFFPVATCANCRMWCVAVNVAPYLCNVHVTHSFNRAPQHTRSASSHSTGTQALFFCDVSVPPTRLTRGNTWLMFFPSHRACVRVPRLPWSHWLPCTGVATKLLAAAVAAATDAGFEQLSLWCKATSPRMLAFYSSHGFAVEEVCSSPAGADVGRVHIMTLDLCT